MLFLEKAARCMNHSNHQEKVFKTAFELAWGKMIPINNASKYHRTVAVYVDDESLIIVLASACKWPIKAILMLPRALGFSV